MQVPGSLCEARNQRDLAPVAETADEKVVPPIPVIVKPASERVPRIGSLLTPDHHVRLRQAQVLQQRPKHEVRGSGVALVRSAHTNGSNHQIIDPVRIKVPGKDRASGPADVYRFAMKSMCFSRRYVGDIRRACGRVAIKRGSDNVDVIACSNRRAEAVSRGRPRNDLRLRER